MDYTLLEHLKLSEMQKYYALLFWKCEHSFLNIQTVVLQFGLLCVIIVCRLFNS